MSKCRKGTYQNSNSDDRAAKSLHKVRTGSGSDRVVSESSTTAVTTSPCPIGERMIAYAYRPGRYRVVSEKLNDGGHNKSSPYWRTNDRVCVSTRSLPVRFREFNDGGHNKSLPFGERMIAHAYRLGRYRVVSEKLNDGGHNKSSPYWRTNDRVCVSTRSL